VALLPARLEGRTFQMMDILREAQSAKPSPPR
jgi:hypothetical protein